MIRRGGLIVLFVLIALLVASPTVAVPIPQLSLDVPDTVPIGDDFTFTLTFQNTSPTDVGYGPFIDIVFPFNGADGNAGSAMPDGIDFIQATYLGAPVQTTQITFPNDDGAGNGCVDHPLLRDANLRRVEICGTSGDKLVVLQLPFGSVVPAQPAIEIEIDASVSDLADLNVPLDIWVRSGFQFGGTPVDDPCCDPPNLTDWTAAPVTPSLITALKENNAPESEIATGPNGVHTWTITLDVPNGQTITDLDVTDYLPNSIVVDVSSVTTTPGNGTVIDAPPAGGPANPPDNELVINFPSVAGGAGSDDIVIEFDFVAQFVDADGSPVISPQTGDDTEAVNRISAVGDWTPNDPRDGGDRDNATFNGECPTVCPGGNAPTLMSIAGQKTGLTVPNGAPIKAGTVIEYTIFFQVSDYFVFDNVVVTDTLSDGQDFDATFTPILSLTGGGMTNFTATPQADGSTLLVFRITDETGAPLLGGCVPAGGTGGGAPDCSTNNGATEGSIIYRAIVRDDFQGNFPDPSVDHGDLLTNEMIITGEILDSGDAATNLGSSEDDDSMAELSVARGDPMKSIYAINGVPCGTCQNIQIGPLDTITYRIQQEMPSSDFEEYTIVDYLPLPVFSAAELTTFSTALDNSVPPAGTAKLLVPTDTLHTLTGGFPTLTTDAATNRIVFDFGSFDTPTNQQSFVDLVFTVTMGTAPIADGLFLTNFLQSVEESTNNDLETLEDIVQVEVLNPYLTISKGAVASTSPDAQFSPRTTGPVTFNGPGAGTPFNGVINSDGLAGAPIDSDLTGVQPGDIISFAVVIENLGSSPKGAFDIIVRDLLPDGMQIPPGGLNLQVRLGNGVEVNWQGVNNGGADDFFGGGIELTDPGIDTGVCGPYNGQDGTNIIIITYDLMLLDPPENVLENTSTIITYSSGEGGGDHTGEQDREDSSLITFSGGGSGGGDGGGSGDGGSGGGGGEVIIDKQIVTPFALPGEPVTWVIDVTNNGGVPVPNVEVVDNIPGGIEVRNATTTAGTVSVDGSSYRITIDTLAPGQTVTVTINARVGADVEPPYIITNEALLLIGGAQVAADDSSVVSVNQLAATGESNGLRWVALIALLSGGTLIGLGYLTVRRSRR